MTPGVKVPDDLVEVGHIAGAFGIRGWVRIRPYSKDADALLHARTWWLDKPQMRDVERLNAKWHGDEVVAQLMGVADRDTAEALKGNVVSISRRHFPALETNEFYWIDLIGLDVVNKEGVLLGRVADLMDNGAHPILRVAKPDDGALEKPREQLIPFVEAFVGEVDQAAKRITVDWQADY